MLSTGARGAVEVLPHVLLVALDIDVVPEVGRDGLEGWAYYYEGRPSKAARDLAEGRGRVGDAATTLLTLEAGTLAEDELLTFGWQGSDGTKAGDIYNPKPWKTYDLPDPDLASDVTENNDIYTISLTARAMAFFVTAEADVPGRWSDNAIHLGPGHQARLRFTPAAPGPAPSFTLRHLHSATMT